MAKLAGTKRRAEEGVTVRISCDNDFLRRAEICVGVIAHGKMQKLQFCGMDPQEGAAARGWNDQISGNKKHNTICIDFSDDFAMSGNLSGTGGLRKCIENNAVFRWLDLRGGAAA